MPIFDATTVDPRGTFEPIPAGEYMAIIVGHDVKPTKTGTGKRTNLKFQLIEEGPYKNRLLFEGLNLENPSAQAVAISRGTASAICHCVNVMQPNDWCELYNLQLILVVKLRKNKETGELENHIAGYKTKDGKSPGKTCAPSKPSAPQNTSIGDKPWAKR